MNRFYIYDEYNRLVKVKHATSDGGEKTLKGKYFYDAAGLRIKKIENGKTTIYIYSGQNILFEERFN